MKLNDAFPSKYLKAGDLPDGRMVPVTIESVKLEQFGDGDKKQTKFIIAFVGKEKELVVNKTNANQIAKLYGDETDDWVGKRIQLFRTEVQFKDDMVEAIRISSKPPPPAATGSLAAELETPPATGDPDWDEPEIPY